MNDAATVCDEVTLSDLVRPLLADIAVLQICKRSSKGLWTAQYAAGTHAMPASSATTGDEHIEDLIDWIESPDRERVAIALVSASRGLDRWRGACQIKGADGGLLFVDLDVRRLTIRPEYTLLCMLARDRTHERQTERTLAELREHWALASAAAGLGTLSFEVVNRRLHLDPSAAKQHGLGADHSGTLSLDEWVGMIVEEDRLKADTLLTLHRHLQRRHEGTVSGRDAAKEVGGREGQQEQTRIHVTG